MAAANFPSSAEQMKYQYSYEKHTNGFRYSYHLLNV